MIPKIGDVVYLIYYSKIAIFEILNIYETVGLTCPTACKFEICVLAGNWPLSYIFVDKTKLLKDDHIALVDADVYMIFDEETFINFVKTYDIT